MRSGLAFFVAALVSPSIIATVVVAALATSPVHAGPVIVESQNPSTHFAAPPINPAEPDVADTVIASDNNRLNATLDRTLNPMDETNPVLASQDSIFTDAPDVFFVNAQGQMRHVSNGINPSEIQASNPIDFSTSNAAVPLPSAAVPGMLLLTGVVALGLGRRMRLAQL